MGRLRYEHKMGGIYNIYCKVCLITSSISYTSCASPLCTRILYPTDDIPPVSSDPEGLQRLRKIKAYDIARIVESGAVLQ